ncbi:MAG: glycosyltransferase family A protein [Limisphaerales bacterium]
MTFQPPPIIPSVREDGQPLLFWSVMIPAYNPGRNYLEQTIRSVLKQDPGPEQMQIEVVDDCSPKVDVAALVQEIAGERVSVSRTPKNLGLAGCWNTCIERSRGKWVHILHQDDFLAPGFYDALRQLTERHPSMALVAAVRFLLMKMMSF